jgi:diguanylate cyclase (GGDEF)-like protein
MVRTGVPRAIDAALLVMGAAPPLLVLVTARALPPAELEPAGLGWIIPALSGALVAASSALALAWLVGGMRSGATAAFLAASSAAAVAGGALVLLLTGERHAMGLALATAGTLALAATVAAPGDRILDRRRSRILAAGAGLLLAEVAVIAGTLPGPTPLVASWRDPLLVAAAGTAGLAAFGARERWLAAAAAGGAVGAVGVLLDRGAGLELVIGLLALVTASLAGLRAVAGWGSGEPSASLTGGRQLPALAHGLTDAVMQFDGSLGLSDWNAPAAALLGLDPAARGARLGDLLGVSLAELPAPGGVTVATAVGGLEIRLHRTDDGIVAVVGDGSPRGDAERLGRELRGTIEELLQTRRTIELQRAELERSSTVDPLTGVASRGALLDRLETEIAQARRYRHPVAVALLDVDGFAGINHRHGIGGGDTVLREVALRMRLRVREADALGRAGSDAFLAVLPHTDEGGAATFASALRHRLAQRPLLVGDELVTLTVSVGVAVMRPGEALDLDDLLTRVGEALDSARAAGGNRIALDRAHGLARVEERDMPSEPNGPRTQDSGH